MHGRQVVVSGASGLIGSALVDRYSMAGYTVRKLVRRSDAGSLQTDEVRWNPLSGLSDAGELNSVDCVVHLAGRSVAAARWNAAEKQRFRDSRIEATRILASQLSELPIPPKVFVCASAIGIYGNQGKNRVDESTVAGHDFLANVAREWEESAGVLSAVGVRVIHARFGIVLSKSGGALAKVLPLFRRGLGGKLGSGEQMWSWIALADCVSAVQWLAEQTDASGAYNVVAPAAVSNAEFTRILAGVLRVPAFLTVPAFGLRLAMGEMADALLLSSCDARPARLLDAGFQFQFPELEGCFSHELATKLVA